MSLDDGLPVVADTNLKRLLAAALMGAQDLEAALQQLLTQRNILTAVGAQLDVIGKIVGQARDGLSDDDFRRYCRARIAAHKSKGATEDLIKVISLVVLDDAAVVQVLNEGAATVRIFVHEISMADSLAAICFAFGQDTASAGVRVVFEWGRSPTAGLFRLDAGPGLDVGKLAGGLG